MEWRRAGVRAGLLALAVLIGTGAGATSASGQGGDLPPLFTATDLRLDPSRLQPHRLVLEPLAERYDARFQRGRVQVHITLERGERSVGDSVRPWHRVRWTANTHPYEDSGLLDGVTLGLRSQTTPVPAPASRHAVYGDGSVVVAMLRPDTAAESRVRDLAHDEYYHVISIPYVMAASDLEAGARFRLPHYALSADLDTTFVVDVIGHDSITDDRGELRRVWRVHTDHGGARIQWYLDRYNAPHLLGYHWEWLSDGEVTRTSTVWVRRWVEYSFDRTDNVFKRPDG